MKIKCCLTVILMILSLSFAYAENGGNLVQTDLSEHPVSGETEPKHNESTNTKHRLPSCLIPCVISEAGVAFQMDCPPEILVYEIADADGNVIASFGDEASFVQTLFSLTGDYTVVFTTAGYVYYGWVSI